MQSQTPMYIYKPRNRRSVIFLARLRNVVGRVGYVIGAVAPFLFILLGCLALGLMFGPGKLLLFLAGVIVGAICL